MTRGGNGLGAKRPGFIWMIGASLTIFRQNWKKIKKNLSFVELLKILWKIEHLLILLQKSECSIFCNIFNYIIFQKRYYGVKG